jgi:heptosyltransferase-3
MVKDPVPLGEVRRALVVKLRHHGDVLLSSPVFSVLHAHAPHIEIDALVYADTAEMLMQHPAIAQLHTIDRRWKKQGPVAHAVAEWRLLQTLRARRYDLIVHLTEHPRVAWLARLCGASWAVAPEMKQRGAFWKNSFSHFYGKPANALRHTVERNLDALRRIGLYPAADERALTLVPGRQAEARVALLLREQGIEASEAGRFIHVHPASRWHFKCWPVDKMAALTAQARLFIGVDSAPMHIAAAVATPAVALFGPSGDREWGPWGVGHRVVTSDAHPCRPCGIDGCGGSKVSDCLTTLSVDRVHAAVQELLSR